MQFSMRSVGLHTGLSKLNRSQACGAFSFLPTTQVSHPLSKTLCNPYQGLLASNRAVGVRWVCAGQDLTRGGGVL